MLGPEAVSPAGNAKFVVMSQADSTGTCLKWLCRMGGQALHWCLSTSACLWGCKVSADVAAQMQLSLYNMATGHSCV